jgi:YesN/AraC family two-component response regulator
VVGAVNVSSLSEQLFVNTRFISAGSTSSLALGVNSSQSETANTIDYYQIKSYMFKNKEEASEQYKLLKTLQSHDDTMARALYNEICEQALYHPRNNIEFIKSKIIEFIFVLYQSSVQDGADIKNVMQLKNRAIMEIDDLGDLNDVIVWLNRINDQFSNFMLKNPNSKHADVIKRAMAYILDHYDEKITLDDIANHVSFSPTYLCSLFKSETGQGFKTCLKKIRIEQSKKLMEEGALSIAEISYKVGFSDQSYFARVFKQYVGVSPYHYRLTCRAVV